MAITNHYLRFGVDTRNWQVGCQKTTKNWPIRLPFCRADSIVYWGRDHRRQKSVPGSVRLATHYNPSFGGRRNEKHL